MKPSEQDLLREMLMMGTPSTPLHATATANPASPPLVTTVSPAVAQPASATITTPPRTPRARTNPTSYDLAMNTLAHCAAFAAALGLWWVGAQFTLSFVQSLGWNVESLGFAQWLIPMFVTAVEIQFWPKRGQNRNLLWLFLIVAGIDLFTSVVGGHAWLSGRTIGTWTLPTTASWVWIASFVIALICALWPEKLARAAIADLRTLWKI